MADLPLKIMLLATATSPNVQSWRTGLDRAGCDVHLLTLHVPSSLDTHVYAIPTPHLPTVLEKLRYILAVPHTRQLISQIRPDIVLAYYVTGYGTLGALLNFHPIVQITAGYDILMSLDHPVMRHLVRYNLNQADLVTSWSPHMTDAIQRFGIPASKIMTRPRGIDLALFTDRQTTVAMPTKTPRLISTRSLYSEYRVDKLIEAVNVLHREGIEAYLTVVGDGPEMAVLRSLTSRLGLEPYIEFRGRLPNAAIPPLLAQHDLYISLFDGDGVSASLLEAMAIGVFPIVFDYAANHTWIQSGQNGLFINGFEPAHIARVIQQAVEDVDLRRRAQRQNPPIIENKGNLYRNTALYAAKFRSLVAAAR